MSICVISCSLNPDSRSRILAHAASQRLTQLGAAPAFVDLRDYELPLCDGYAAGEAPAVTALKSHIQEASGVLLALPVYNFNVSAAAKNLVELTSEVWTEKPVAFVCAAGGRSSYMAVMNLANSLMLDFHSYIVPRFVYASSEAFTGEAITDPAVHERLDAVTGMLLRLSRCLGNSACPAES